MTAPGVPFKRRCAFEPGCDGTPLPFDLACGRHPACAECGGRIMHEIWCRTARAERLAALATERDVELAARVRADERARISRGLSAMADDEARRPGRRDCCSRSIETWLGEAAAFADADPLASGEPVAGRREDLAGDDEARSA